MLVLEMFLFSLSSLGFYIYIYIYIYSKHRINKTFFKACNRTLFSEIVVFILLHRRTIDQLLLPLTKKCIPLKKVTFRH